MATKFGLAFDEGTGRAGGSDVSPAYIRRACEANLRRLGVETIDLYQIHGGIGPSTDLDDVVATLESLVDAGKIRWFGTSDPSRRVVDRMSLSDGAAAVQSELNLFRGDEALAERAGSLSWVYLARSPLAMGLLSGKYRIGTPDDVRAVTLHWDDFRAGSMARYLRARDSVLDILTAGGRTPVQGALSYLWGKSSAIVLIPGVRSVAQAAENAAALSFGPLDTVRVSEIDTLISSVLQSPPSPGGR